MSNYSSRDSGQQSNLPSQTMQPISLRQESFSKRAGLLQEIVRIEDRLLAIDSPDLIPTPAAYILMCGFVQANRAFIDSSRIGVADLQANIKACVSDPEILELINTNLSIVMSALVKHGIVLEKRNPQSYSLNSSPAKGSALEAECIQTVNGAIRKLHPELFKEVVEETETNHGVSNPEDFTVERKPISSGAKVSKQSLSTQVNLFLLKRNIKRRAKELRKMAHSLNYHRPIEDSECSPSQREERTKLQREVGSFLFELSEYNKLLSTDAGKQVCSKFVSIAVSDVSYLLTLLDDTEFHRGWTASRSLTNTVLNHIDEFCKRAPSRRAMLREFAKAGGAVLGCAVAGLAGVSEYRHRSAYGTWTNPKYSPDRRSPLHTVPTPGEHFKDLIQEVMSETVDGLDRIALAEEILKTLRKISAVDLEIEREAAASDMMWEKVREMITPHSINETSFSNQYREAILTACDLTDSYPSPLNPVSFQKLLADAFAKVTGQQLPADLQKAVRHRGDDDVLSTIIREAARIGSSISLVSGNSLVQAVQRVWSRESVTVRDITAGFLFAYCMVAAIDDDLLRENLIIKWNAWIFFGVAEELPTGKFGFGLQTWAALEKFRKPVEAHLFITDPKAEVEALGSLGKEIRDQVRSVIGYSGLCDEVYRVLEQMARPEKLLERREFFQWHNHRERLDWH